MADEKVVIAGTVKVDTTSATKSVKDLKDEIKNLQKEFDNTKVGTEAQQTAYKKLKAAQDELSKSTKALGEGTKDISGHFQTLKENIGGMGGPLTSAGEGVSKLSGAFKALLLNPVVAVIAAIVAALAFLYKSFTNTAEGGEKMEQVFAGIKAAASAVLDAIFKLGGAIIKFFSGDFKGAFNDAKEAITGVVDAATSAYNAVSKLTAQAQQLRKEQAANDIDQAKRATELAKLREQATDPEIAVGKRKAALIELQKAAQEDAKKDLDLAKRVAENKIALLSIGTDAAKKNFAEIAKIRVEQLQGEADSANELRRIGKQITTANKEEEAERKAAADKAKEEAKKRREDLFAFNQQLNKLQQDNALAQIKDDFAKQKQALENSIDDQNKALRKQFEDKKITHAQLNQLQEQQDISANNRRNELNDKHNQEIAGKEEAFQKELNKITEKTRLDGITDSRQAERVQLQIGYEEKLQDAIKRYKDDAVKFQQIKQALDTELKAEQDKLTEKNRIEDAKKAFEDSKKHTRNVLNDPATDFDEKQKAIDAELAQVQKAFDAKVLTEEQYNDEIAQLSQARVQISNAEREHTMKVASAVADAFDTLSDLAGKQTATGKALAIASTTIKTFQSAVAAFAGMVETIPGPVGIALGVVAAAGALATGIATVKKIVAVQVPGQGSGGSIPSAPQLPTAPVAPQQSSTKLDQSSINGIGSAIPAARSYVLDSDVKNNAERDARLSRAARLGN